MSGISSIFVLSLGGIAGMTVFYLTAAMIKLEPYLDFKQIVNDKWNIKNKK